MREVFVVGQVRDVTVYLMRQRDQLMKTTQLSVITCDKHKKNHSKLETDSEKDGGRERE